MSSAYQKALDLGYSEQEIDDYLSKKDPRYQKALQHGYSKQEIFGHLQSNQTPSESLGSSTLRQIGRGAARTAETVLGAPRAFGEFLESIVPERGIKKIASKIGLEKPVEAGIKFSKEYAPYKLFPKSEDIRENVTKYLFGKNLEPKNEWEEKADEVVSDFAALALPLPGQQLKVLKPALIALGSNVASELIGQLGGTKNQQQYAKIGTILAGSMINPKAAENVKNELYQKARSSRPESATVKATALKKDVDSYRNILQKGGSAPYKNAALKKLEEIDDVISAGEISLDELEKFKVSINSIRAGLYEEFKGNKAGRKLAKSSLDKVSNIIDKSLDVYGETNPEWKTFYREANEVHGAIAQSQKARNIIASVAKKYGKHAVLPLLGIGHFAGGPGLGVVAGAAGATAAAVTAGELASKFMKSPTLRKLYINLITSGLKEDAVAINENLKKIQQEMKEEE